MELALDLEKHQAQFDWAYKWGMLKPQIHFRLVVEMDQHCAKAHVRPEYVVRPLSAFCGKPEIEFVTGYHKHQDAGVAGLAFIGCYDDMTRIQAMCGAFIRNFVNAEVHTSQQVIENLKAGTMDDPSVLGIPNFFIMKNHGSDVAKWDAGRLLDCLYRRFFARRLTLLGIENMDALSHEYGPGIADHIKQNYIIVEG